jgi:hypothetical protein
MLILVKFWRPSSAESGKGLTVANTLKSRRSAELSLQHRIYFTHGILRICTGKVSRRSRKFHSCPPVCEGRKASRFRFHVSFTVCGKPNKQTNKDLDRPGRRPHILIEVCGLGRLPSGSF